MSKRLGIEEGEKLPRSIVEFCLKRDDLGDPLIAEEHIHAFGWATQAELDEMIAMTLRINDYLQGLFSGIGIKLVDFKIEFADRLSVSISGIEVSSGRRNRRFLLTFLPFVLVIS